VSGRLRKDSREARCRRQNRTLRPVTGLVHAGLAAASPYRDLL
jgi:hypothetical protein